MIRIAASAGIAPENGCAGNAWPTTRKASGLYSVAPAVAAPLQRVAVHSGTVEARDVDGRDHVESEHATGGNIQPDDFVEQTLRVRVDPRQRDPDFAAFPKAVHPHVSGRGSFAMHFLTWLPPLHAILAWDGLVPLTRRRRSRRSRRSSDWRSLYLTVYYQSRPFPVPPGETMRQLRAIVALLLIGLLAGSPLALGADLTVFAAASLKEAMDEQARNFDAATGNKMIVSYGGSNALAKQIEAGAPADLFISADLDWMDYLDQRKLLAPNTRSNLLRNTLVLIAPASSTTTLKIGPHFGLAAALGNDKLAMANPDSVPAGKYGKSALEKLGVWPAVEKQVARADNVRAALALVSRGEAPLGIVYRTDAMADRGVRIVDTFPADTHVRRSSTRSPSSPRANRPPPSRCSTTCARRPRGRPGRSTASASSRNNRWLWSRPTSSASSC